MNLLFVVATFGEVAPFLQFLGCKEESKQNLYKYQYAYLQIEILITGAGMVHTAFHLGRLLLQKQYEWVFNIGIAGSFDKKLKIGQIVQVQSQVFGDMGAEDKEDFIPITEMIFFDENQFPYKEGRLYNFNESSLSLLQSLQAVSSVTVNKVSGSKSSIKQIKKNFQADIESMEGAAVFYACLMSRQAFVELRSISNYVEERNKATWNIPLAIKNLNQLLIEIVDSEWKR